LQGLVVTPSVAKLAPGDTIRVRVPAVNGTRAEGSVVDRADFSVACPRLPANPQFWWSSSDAGIAEVDSATGLVHARKSGVATIVATEVTDKRIDGAMVVQVSP
jgi:hypothetical protein